PINLSYKLVNNCPIAPNIRLNQFFLSTSSEATISAAPCSSSLSKIYPKSSPSSIVSSTVPILVPFLIGALNSPSSFNNDSSTLTCILYLSSVPSSVVLVKSSANSRLTSSSFSLSTGSVLPSNSSYPARNSSFSTNSSNQYSNNIVV